LFILIKSLPVHNTSSELVWLFDLDNTLHNASQAIFPALNRNMNVFMTRVLREQGHAADQEQVNYLRQLYWRQYGATLLGLMHHHQVKAEDFLRETHTFEDLVGMIAAERGLLRFLHRLPGKKILLTNAPLEYANTVVQHLGLHRSFSKSVSIESMYVHKHLRPKPSRQLIRKLLAKEKIPAHRCILIEDTAINLKAAKQEGLHTVWMTRYLSSNPHAQLHDLQRQMAMRPAYVDMKIHSIRQLQQYAKRLVETVL
jgi:putative hydrolase of the HAD superfamily